MKIKVLGSGTSQGVPVIACHCQVCQSIDPKDKRTRCSIYIQKGNTHLVVDTGPDFRTQILREKIEDLDAVLFTHEHKDHVAGLDDIRAFNFKEGGKPMNVYASLRVQEALHREFSYVFSENKYPGIPEINLCTLTNDDFKVNDLRIIPINAMHFKLPVKGFRIENFAYVTDANYIEESELEKLMNLEVLIINALRKSKHISHFNLEQAIEVIKKLNPKKAYLTHISHLMGRHKDVELELPSNVHLAYDGLQINL